MVATVSQFLGEINLDYVLLSYGGSEVIIFPGSCSFVQQILTKHLLHARQRFRH